MTQSPKRDLEKKIDSVLKIANENSEKIAKIYRWNRIRQVVFWLKVIVFVLIMVSTWFYIPSFVNKLMTAYQEAMGNYQNTTSAIDDLNEMTSGNLKK